MAYLQACSYLLAIRTVMNRFAAQNYASRQSFETKDWPGRLSDGHTVRMAYPVAIPDRPAACTVDGRRVYGRSHIHRRTTIRFVSIRIPNECEYGSLPAPSLTPIMERLCANELTEKFVTPLS